MLNASAADCLNLQVDVEGWEWWEWSPLTAAACLNPQVDVEGWEWSVMKGGAEMFKKYKVDNVIMEYSPGASSKSHVRAVPPRWEQCIPGGSGTRCIV